MPFRPSKRKRHKGKKADPYLMLTPMVDIFICLLLFLLQSYSSLEEIVVSEKGFQLPVSTSMVTPHSAVTIKVNTDVIVVDGEVIAKTGPVLQDPELMIRPLFQQLIEKSENSRFIASKNQSMKFRGEVVIQGDQEIPFMLLKKIMYTCSRAEFGNIALAVLQKGT